VASSRGSDWLTTCRDTLYPVGRRGGGWWCRCMRATQHWRRGWYSLSILHHHHQRRASQGKLVEECWGPAAAPHAQSVTQHAAASSRSSPHRTYLLTNSAAHYYWDPRRCIACEKHSVYY
jgi:hypothetical protein